MLPQLALAKEQFANAARNAAGIFRGSFHQDAGMKELIARFHHSAATGAPPPIPYREIELTARIMDSMFALQHAAETGTQADLDVVFNRRDSHNTIRLALVILIVVSAVVLASRWFDFGSPRPEPFPVPQQQAAVAAGIVGMGDPF